MSERATFTILATHPTVADRERREAGIRRLLESHGYTVRCIDIAGETVERGITPAQPRRGHRAPDPFDIEPYGPLSRCEGMGI